MKKFFSEVFDRVTSQTPAFFKKLQAIGGSIAGVGLAFSSINVPGTPSSLHMIGNNFMLVGAVIAAVCQFAKADTPKEP